MDHEGHEGRWQISRRDALRLGAGFPVAGVLPGIAFTDAPVVTRVVNTRNGPVQGLVKNDVQIFKGLRYAAPPLGSLRFPAPQNLEPWTQAAQATQFGAALLALEIPTTAGSHWPAYDVEKRATTTFNTPRKVVDDLEAEIRKIPEA